VISTDLSHYHPYDEARRIDADTLARIGACASDLAHEQACGATALNGFLQLCRSKRLQLRLLAACNSGDTAGGKDRVVGYAALAAYDESEPAAADAGRALLEIAKGAIANGLGLSSVPVKRDHLPWLLRPGASFVTLMREGRLRGCIGSLAARRPLGQDVAANARAAAFEDPRFPKLTRGEWPGCAVEVSLLSASKPIRFADEAELLARIQPGLDGLTLECDGKHATFLPQVWETLPDKRRFLGELLKKAGLPPDTRLTRCAIRRYRVAKFT
jgi:AmmeMemoRadiSam system protein A